MKTSDLKAIKVLKLFAGIPREYDLFLALFTFLMDHAWRRAVLAESGCRGLVLDIATGTGLMPVEFAKRDENVFVVGVDLSKPMLLKAKRSLRNSPFNYRVDLVMARAESLPIRGEVFNSSTITLALRNLSDPESAFKEMSRVLAPNGRAVSLDFTRPPDRIFRLIYYFYIFRLLPLLGGLVSDAWGDIFNYLCASIDRARSPDKVADIMRGVGLAKVRWTYLSKGIVGLVSGVRQR